MGKILQYINIILIDIYKKHYTYYDGDIKGYDLFRFD